MKTADGEYFSRLLRSFLERVRHPHVSPSAHLRPVPGDGQDTLHDESADDGHDCFGGVALPAHGGGELAEGVANFHDNVPRRSRAVH